MNQMLKVTRAAPISSISAKQTESTEMFAAYRNHAAVYRRLDVETSVDAANPHKLIAMLFDGAVSAVQRARSAIEAGDIAAKAQAITRAIRIVDEGLKASLDPSAGILTSRLQDLYGYMSGRLLMASVRNDVEILDEVNRLLEQLRDAWSQIAPSAAAPAAAPRRPSLNAYAA